MNHSIRKKAIASAATLAIGAAALPGAALAQDQELTILVEGGGESLQQAIAEKFTEETGVKVTFDTVGYADVFQKLQADLATGGGAYDVATIDVIWLPTFGDFVEPLDDLFTDEVIADLPAALVADGQNADGTYIGMPTWANTEILFYRTDLLEDPEHQAAFEAEYGYPLAVPTDWQTFRDVANYFTQDTDGDGNTDLYGAYVKGAVETEWLAHVLQAGSPGVVFDADGNIIIDNAEHQAALEFYAGLNCEDGVSPPGVASIGWDEAQNGFYSGQTALLRFWGHAWGFIPEDAVVAGNVGVAPMIAGEAGVAGIPGPWYNVVPSSSNNVELAKQFVKFAYDNNELGIDAPLGLAARNSVYEENAGEPGRENFEPLLATLAADATQGRPLVEDWQQITDEVLIPLVNRVATCEVDAATALADARAQIEAMRS
jgi:ABC-type glycerol-3-phosphate transport system substrate-binding protein